MMDGAAGHAAALLGGRGRAIVPSGLEESFAAIYRAGPGVISLADGYPPRAELPGAEIARALDAALAEPDALAYGPPGGEPALLAAIAGFFDALGVPRRHTVVCGGAAQGLYLALHALASPGDSVLTDSATYCDALATFATLQLDMVGVAHDAEGMQTEALDAAIAAERRRGRRPAAVYLIPTAHNPLGITLPEARRRALVDVSRDHGVAIVEDDTYALFDAAGTLPTLSALAPDLVVRLDTVSKLLGPGLRLGWASGPPEVMAAVEMLKSAVDLGAPVPVQRAVARLLPDLRALVRPQMEGLAARRAALLAALDEHFGAPFTWTRPRGGYFVWLSLPAGLSGRAAMARGLEAGVAVLPGAIFAPDGRDDALRLGCANRTPAELHEAVARLRRALESTASPHQA